MQADFWLERWQQNQIGFHQDVINDHLVDYWSQVNAPQNSQVFVPLCGKSKDMLWLRAQGHSVLGVELSSLAAKDFFAENQLQPTISKHGSLERWQADGIEILVGNYFDLQADDLKHCQTIFDRAALIALPADMRPQYVDHLISIMPATLRGLLVTLEYDQSQAGGPPFAVLESEVEQLYSPHFTLVKLNTVDVLEEMARFKELGINSLDEKVFLLTAKS